MADQASGAPSPSPKDAATVIVVRPIAGPTVLSVGGIEVFCVRRHAQSAFLGGVVVFPGGKLDSADADPAYGDRANGVHPRAPRFADSPDHALALAVSACRECLEEAELLLCRSALRPSQVATLRTALAAATAGAATAGAAFAALLLEHDLHLDTAGLLPFARWITPLGEGRRFDTRFFMTTLPPGQTGRHDDHETVSSVWASPGQLLSAYVAGDLFLAPPTIRTLTLLADCVDVDAALALCADQSLAPVCPEFVPDDPPILALPGDPKHSVPERRVAGPTRFVVRDGLFVAEDP